MTSIIWIANILAWPFIQIGCAAWMLRRPPTAFVRDTWLTRPYRWEQNGRWYRRVLHIHRWMPLLPDGGAWLGKPRRSLSGRNSEQLAGLLFETRRGELAHWYMLAATPVLFLWNPPWACGVMLAYGIAANLPCVLVQRYNRARLRSSLITQSTRPIR